MAFKKPTLKATGGDGEFALRPLLEAAPYNARILQVVDLGLQPGSAEYPDPKHKLEITFELQDECMVDKEGVEIEGKPATFSMEIAYQPDGYMHEKSGIYKFYMAINPEMDKGPAELLDIPCTVIMAQKIRKSGKQKGEAYSAVASVAPMKAKDVAKATPLVGEPLFFDLSEPVFEDWARLTKGNQYAQQDKIKASLEFMTSPLAALLGIEAPEAEADGEADGVAAEAFEADAGTVASTGGAAPQNAAEEADEEDPFA